MLCQIQDLQAILACAEHRGMVWTPKDMRKPTVAEKEEQHEEEGTGSSYTVDLDDLEKLGDLADLDIESFMLDGQADSSNTVMDSEPKASAAAPSAKTEEPTPEPEPSEVVDIDGTTDRVVPTTKEITAGSPEHAAKLQEQYTRLAADYENFRKRSKRESEESVKFANEQILRALLPIMDNLDRALESGGDPKATLSGVKMVVKQFAQDLRRFGLKGFDAMGTKFDPKAHEAFEMVESSDEEAGTVVRVYQKGYWMHERLLRPAMVAVAKAKTVPPEPVADENVSPAEEEAPEQVDTSAENSGETESTETSES